MINMDYERVLDLLCNLFALYRDEWIDEKDVAIVLDIVETAYAKENTEG